MSKDRKLYRDCQEVVDAVMEWIGMKWTKSMITRELRDFFPDLKSGTVITLINAARKRIRETYGIDPNEYKGMQIAFYEAVIRGTVKGNTGDKLRAAERLDKLFNLEGITDIDPALLAQKILEFKRQAMRTVGGQSDGRSEDEGEGKDDAGNGEGSTQSAEPTNAEASEEVQADKGLGRMVERPKDTGKTESDNESVGANNNAKTPKEIQADAVTSQEETSIGSDEVISSEVSEALKLPSGD